MLGSLRFRGWGESDRLNPRTVRVSGELVGMRARLMGGPCDGQIGDDVSESPAEHLHGIRVRLPPSRQAAGRDGLAADEHDPALGDQRLQLTQDALNLFVRERRLVGHRGSASRASQTR